MSDEVLNDGRARLLRSRAALQSSLAEGRRRADNLLALPISQWRSAMRKDPSFRAFGTLMALLREAHERLETEPTTARELTSAVLAYADQTEGPAPVNTLNLRALARKEHANALRVTGDPSAALIAVREARRIYAEAGSLEFEAARAKLVEAQVLIELDDYDRAIELCRESAGVFRDHRESSSLIVACMTEGWILGSRKQFKAAMDIFVSLAEAAEREGDASTLARALHNTAICARELGDVPTARDLYGRAVSLFESSGLATELPRVRWGYALCLVAEGSIHEGISELYKTRALYLSLGMNTDAAMASLDIVRSRFEQGRDIADLCGEILRTFAAAGMTQNAIEALAYLREQAERGAGSDAAIGAVRDYLGELSRHPSLAFVPRERSLSDARTPLRPN